MNAPRSSGWAMRMPKRPSVPAALCLALLTTGCATGFSVTDTSCKSFKPIAASVKDTTETKRQVVQHNAAYDAICPSKV